MRIKDGDSSQGETNPIKCDTPCTGGGGEICGGDGAMSVYKTGYYKGCINDKLTTPDLPHRAPVEGALP